MASERQDNRKYHHDTYLNLMYEVQEAAHTGRRLIERNRRWWGNEQTLAEDAAQVAMKLARVEAYAGSAVKAADERDDLSRMAVEIEQLAAEARERLNRERQFGNPFTLAELTVRETRPTLARLWQMAGKAIKEMRTGSRRSEAARRRGR